MSEHDIELYSFVQRSSMSITFSEGVTVILL